MNEVVQKRIVARADVEALLAGWVKATHSSRVGRSITVHGKAGVDEYTAHLLDEGPEGIGPVRHVLRCCGLTLDDEPVADAAETG